MRRAVAIGVATALAGAGALAQSVEPGKPLTLVVGRPASPQPTVRADGARRGLASAGLPSGALRVLWRRSAGPSVAHAPVVLPGGDIVVGTGRGELVQIAPDGAEKRRVSVGTGPLGPATVLANGIVVVTTASGEVTGLELGASSVRVVFRTRLGDEGQASPVAPLPLDDGGLAVAAFVQGPEGRPVSELATLDAEGHVRARVILPGLVAWPLVATSLGVAAVSEGGSVFLWPPGGGPVRASSFGGVVSGGAAATDATTLVGVVDARRLVAVDLARRVERTWMTSAGVLLGPPAVTVEGKVVVLEVSSGTEQAVLVDAGGGIRALPTAKVGLGAEADGGTSALLVPVHTSLLVDGQGRVAFAGAGGHVGVTSVEGMTDLGEPMCPRGAPPNEPGSGGRPSAGFAGMASAGPGVFLVACEGGSVFEVGRTP